MTSPRTIRTTKWRKLPCLLALCIKLQVAERNKKKNWTGMQGCSSARELVLAHMFYIFFRFVTNNHTFTIGIHYSHLPTFEWHKSSGLNTLQCRGKKKHCDTYKNSGTHVIRKKYPCWLLIALMFFAKRSGNGAKTAPKLRNSIAKGDNAG